MPAGGRHWLALTGEHIPSIATPEFSLSPQSAPAFSLPAAGAKDLKQQLEAGVNWPTPGSAFWEKPPRSAPLPVAPPAGLGAAGVQDQRRMHVVHITAEMAPHAKVGRGSEQLPWLRWHD